MGSPTFGAIVRRRFGIDALTRAAAAGTADAAQMAAALDFPPPRRRRFPS